MNNRYFKIFVCVLMVCCLLFSFTATAFAASAPVDIGGFGAAIADIIAYSMGIDYEYSEVDKQGLQEFFELIEDIQEQVWKVQVTAGLTTIALGQTAVQSIADYVKDQILRDDILPNTEGLITTQEVRTFDGYHFKNFAGTIRTDAIGSVVSPGKWSDLPDGYTIDVTSSDPRYASAHIVKTTYTRANIQWYYLTNLVSVSNNVNMGSVAHTYYLVLSVLSNNVSVGLCSDAHNYVDFRSDTIGNPVDVTQSISYVSGTIDTTVTDNIPSTGGMLITFPTAASSSVTDALEDLQNLVLENSQSIEYEYTDDVGQPMPYDTNIADTPYSSLDETLNAIVSGISDTNSYVGSISQVISGAIRQSLDDIKVSVGSAVSSLEGILSGLGEMTDTIELGETGVVKAYIESFIELYLPWIQELGSFGSIWHYVVSWIGSISSCFSWSLSAVSSAGSIFMAPIYAAFAGTVVIAIYRRFGR